MGKKLWLLELSAPETATDLLEALLASEAPWGWEEKQRDDGTILFGLFCEDKGLLEKIADSAKKLSERVSARIEATEKRDWQLAWREFFTPVEAGSRFVILPTWLAHLGHTRRKEIIIEPKMAFGTGHHASTVLCLEALSELLDKKRLGKNDWFLDLGCGTGILGLAAAKSGLSGTGLDIDPIAVENARENRELNEAESLELLKGGIEKIKGEKFELIMANILSQPLIDMAPQITAALAKKAYLILGGILSTQAESVIKAYKDCGLPDVSSRLASGEWCALVWAKDG